MSKHTKGPWHTDGDGMIIWAGDKDNASNMVADIRGYGHMTAVEGLTPKEAAERQIANGDLIAAAPDLLEALEMFVESYEKCLQLEKTDQALLKAKSAISKAKGEENDKEI